MSDRYENQGRNRRDRNNNQYSQGYGDRQQQQFESNNDGYGQDRGYGQQEGYQNDYRQTDNAYGAYDERGQRSDFSNSGNRSSGSDRAGYERDGRNMRAGADNRMNYDNGSDRFGSFNSNDYGGRDFERNGSRGFGRGSYGQTGGQYAGTMGHNRNARDDRGFFDKAGDEIASWFGDDDAERRRERDHRGRGPSNYKRSDERILEDCCDQLTDDWAVDASDITVTVQDAEVTLDGHVDDRQGKRRAEDCVHDISGVKHVQNNLRISESERQYERTRSQDDTIRS